MNVEEFDTALSDLETRVDRLRALYENWFRGYEKTEPGVARKDVERRVYGLRKELPRNTALRFRYHQLYQRYTTLASYWQRTARQIEEGTYRLQLKRIKRRRDDDVARTLPPPSRTGDEGSTNPPPAYELNLDETLDVRNLLDELDLDQVANALDVPRSKPESIQPDARATANMAAYVRGSGKKPSLPSLDEVPVIARAEPAAPAASAAAKRFARPTKDDANLRPPAMAPANDVTPVETRDSQPSVGKITGSQPTRDSQPTAGGSQPAMPRPPALPARPAPPPPPAAAARAPTAPGTGTVPMPPPRAPGTGTVPMPPPPSKVAAKAPPAVPPPRAPAPPAVRAPATTATAPAVRPVATTGTAAAVRAPATTGAVAKVDSPLSDQRMRSIYEEYAAARKKNNEADVRFETLAGSIQKMLPDLSKKHAGKQIDFEVVVKDGRVGLKPKPV